MSYDRNSKKLVLAERLAQCLAFETMRKLGWSSRPEILQEETPSLLRRENNWMMFLVRFPLWNDRESQYKIIIQLSGDDLNQKWMGGFVFAFHCTTGVHFDTNFYIDWDEPGGPKPVLGGEFIRGSETGFELKDFVS